MATLKITEYTNALVVVLGGTDVILCSCYSCRNVDGRIKLNTAYGFVFGNGHVDARCEYYQLDAKMCMRFVLRLLHYFEHLARKNAIVRVEMYAWNDFIRHADKITDLFGQIHKITLQTVNPTHVCSLGKKVLQNIPEICVAAQGIANKLTYNDLVAQLNNMHCRKLIFIDYHNIYLDILTDIKSTSILDFIYIDEFVNVHGYNVIKNMLPNDDRYVDICVPQIARNRARYYNSLAKLCMLCLYLHDISVELVGVQDIVDDYYALYLPSIAF